MTTAMQVSEETVQPVLNAANFLGVPPIVDACCQVHFRHSILHSSDVHRSLGTVPSRAARLGSAPTSVLLAQFLQRKLQPDTCLAITQLAARHALHDLTAQVGHVPLLNPVVGCCSDPTAVVQITLAPAQTRVRDDTSR